MERLLSVTGKTHKELRRQFPWMDGKMSHATKEETHFLLLVIRFLKDMNDEKVTIPLPKVWCFFEQKRLSLYDVLQTALEEAALTYALKKELSKMPTRTKMILFEDLEKRFPYEQGLLLTLSLMILSDNMENKLGHFAGEGENL